ncbi:extracellular ligand binding protein [Caballeronia hypogeia]|uniref:Extracellular ligand binding protein n=1 Tax=Caballeronia hypogeia TaxID=1777140 RepID=A0A158AAN2_9BURK|nr:ABC transporter substrate-binding protein [Caballeronia hypogeia]SAK54891.1 extracellular ligand binding protein [Caballeronia hypogeia]
MGKAGEDFQTRFAKRFIVPNQTNAPFAYDSVYIFVDAMKRENSTDPAKVLSAMPSPDYTGVTSETQFDAHGDLLHGVVSMYDYKAGKKTLVSKITM